MKGISQLPEGYHEIFRIDLQKDKKPGLIVNAGSVVIFIVLALLGQRIVPFSAALAADSPAFHLVRLFTAAAGTALYLFLHEMTHGILMQVLGKERTGYGFAGMFGYAKNSAYFHKKSYIIISLTPVMIWGIVLGILCALMPVSLFWIAYFWQMVNIASAAGDFYVAWIAVRMPADALIQDQGVSFAVFYT